MKTISLTGRAMLARAWSTARVASVGVAVISALMAALVTAWALGFGNMSAELGNARVNNTSSLTRDLSAVGQGWAMWNDEPPAVGVEVFDDPEAWDSALGFITEQLSQFRSSLSPELQSVTGKGQFRVLNAELPVNTVDGSDVRFPSIQPGYAPDLFQRVELTQGRYPQQTHPSNGIEILVSQASADRLSWKVGESRISALIPDEPLVLVGTYAPNDPDDGYWEHATTSVLPYVNADPNAGTSVMATAYLAPNQLVSSGGAQRVDAWFPIDDIRGVDAKLIAQELTTVSAISSNSGVGLVFSSGLANVLDNVVSDINAVESLALFLVTVPLLALIVSGLVAVRALVTQHAQSLYVVNTRGASRTQQALWVIALGSVLVLPGIAVGVLAAWLLLDDVSSQLATPVVWVGCFAIYVLMISLLLGFAAQTSRTAAHGAAVAERESSTKRWVLFSCVITMIAVGALYLVRSGSIASNDVISYLLPAFVTLAGVGLGVTLLKVVMATLGAITARGKSLALYLGFAQAGRANTATVQKIATVITMTAMTIMAGGLLVSLSSGVATGAQETTGADIKLSGPFFVESEVQKLDGIEDIAGYSTVMNVNPAAIRTSAGQRGVRLYVAPIDQLRTLRAYKNLGVEELRSDTAQLNVITTRSLDELIATDAGHVLNTGAGQYSLNPIRIRAGLDGLNQTNSFLLADSTRIEEQNKYRPTVLLVDAAAHMKPQEVRDLAATLEEIFPGAAVELQHDTLTQKTNDPTLKWLRLGVLAGLVVTMVAGASALWFAYLNQARARKRETYILKHLGISAPRIKSVARASTLSWLLPSIVWGCISGAALAAIALSIVDVSHITGLSGQLGNAHILVIAALGIVGSLMVAGIAVLVPVASHALKARKS